MDVQYRNKKIEKECTNYSVANRKYGQRMAELIAQRVGELRAASSVEEMVAYGIGRCHKLSLNRKGQYALDLVHPKRLVFEKKGEDVQIALIEEIIDYH